MNAKKISTSIAKRITAVAMAAAIGFSAAGGATLLSSDSTGFSVKAASDSVASVYYDAGTLKLGVNAQATEAKSLLKDPLTVSNKSITLSDTVNISGDHPIQLTFIDDGVNRESATYSYVAKGTSSTDSNGDIVIDWEVKAWPQNQNNIAVPTTSVSAQSSWDSGDFVNAGPVWTTTDWRQNNNSPNPWLSIITVPFDANNVDHVTYDLDLSRYFDSTTSYRETVDGGFIVNLYDHNGSLNDDYHIAISEKSDGGMPVYSTGLTYYNNETFESLTTKTEPDEDHKTKTTYPTYAIPYFIADTWANYCAKMVVDEDLTITGLRLEHMDSTVTLCPKFVAAAGYKGTTDIYDWEFFGNEAEFNVFQAASDYVTATPSNYKSGYNVGVVRNYKDEKVSVVYTEVPTITVDQLADYFCKADVTLKINSANHVEVGNTRATFVIDTNVVYSVAHGLSRAEGTVTGYPITPEPELPVPELHPAITSTVASAAAGSFVHEIECADSVAINDRVFYDELDIGKTYTLKTVVVEKETEKPVITEQSMDFEAKTAGQGYVDVSITLNTLEYEGKKLVVYEYLYLGNVLLDTHEDLEDRNQTVTVVTKPVSVPSIIKTIATAAAGSASHEIKCAADAVINDRVVYDKLETGKSYTMLTSVVDKETEKFVVTEQPTAFTADAKGYVDIEISLNTLEYEGKDLVVCEYIQLDGEELCRHEDFDDLNQTVTVVTNPVEPEIEPSIVSTTATAVDSTSHSIKYAEAVKINDHIIYDGLEAGKIYTLSTSVVDKATGKFVVSDISATFTANELGYTDIVISLNTLSYSGKDLVVYETISRDGKELCQHKDINDTNQTVTVEKKPVVIVPVPSITQTIATNGTNVFNVDNNYNWTLGGYNKTVPYTERAVINDRVYYEDLDDGITYMITPTVYDANSGLMVNIATESSFFVANSAKGYIDVSISFDATKYAGRTLVVFEKISTYDRDLRRETEICSHQDLRDTNQMVYVSEKPGEIIVPETAKILKTVATSNITGTHTLEYSSTATIKDIIYYSGLTNNQVYTVISSVYDKSTGKVILDNYIGTFKADTTGMVSVTITFDATAYEGKDLVVCEAIYSGATLVCEHHDLTDKEQTVTVEKKPVTKPPVNNDPDDPFIFVEIPENTSVAVDYINRTHTMSYSANATILNTVEYKGLENGKQYTVTSTVYSKATGNSLGSVSQLFTANSSIGYVQVEIPFDSTAHIGESFVVLASISQDGKTLCSYTDMTDPKATVTVASVSTVLTAENKTSKTVPVSGNTVLVDIVNYDGLTPGQTYTITGYILHREVSGKKTDEVYFDGQEGSVVANGAKILATRTVEFTPTYASGAVTVTFNVDTTGLAGQHLVAFESIADKPTNVIVGEHKDVGDANQTVVVKATSNVYTGGNDMTVFFFTASGICVIAAAGFGGYMLYSRKKRVK